MIINCWDQEEFEDIVARSLIACYESKIKKNRGEPNGTEKDLSVFRRLGPYIPGNDRRIFGIDSDKGFLEIQAIDIPKRPGVVAWPSRKEGYEVAPDSYMFIISFEKVKTMPKRFVRRGAGDAYKLCRILPSSKAIVLSVTYFTLSKEGLISACDQQVSNIRGYMPGNVQKMIKTSEVEPHLLDEQVSAASGALQFSSDKKHSWSITARENSARATLGCMKEEVKSLLYARSLPMTETGRKRPILHLVNAHQRRMKNGTDIDVSTFLRGTQIVEFGGTEFSVNPPISLKPEVTDASRDKYYATQ